jgi:hypothetical protein
VKGKRGFVKGGGRLPKSGRAKGTKNHEPLRADVRATIALVAERKVLELETWLNRVAINDPQKAMDLYLKMIEYHVPRLQRTEVTGLDGAALSVELSAKDAKL